MTQALFNAPVEAVQEVRIQQNNYSAEFGNSSSGVVTITTRSGTNDFHGDAYEFFRNDRLDARNFFAARKAPLCAGTSSAPLRAGRSVATRPSSLATPSGSGSASGWCAC